jgi:hypothetical protein
VEVGQLGDCSGNTGGVDRLVHLARVLGVELGETVGGGRGGEGGGVQRERRERGRRWRRVQQGERVK